MKKKILITAGGTGSAYNLAATARELFGENIEIHVADINRREHVASCSVANKYYQVPLVASADYRNKILNIIETEDIDLIIPLIDHELLEFPSDDSALAALECESTAPPKATVEQFSDKMRLSEWAESNNVRVPATQHLSDLDDLSECFVKPRMGFGSRGAKKMTVLEARELENPDELVFQELCDGPEVTVEIYSGLHHIDSICRERIEVRSGVCTKARVYKDDELHAIAASLCKQNDWPVASCLQFMRGKNGNWLLTDVNLRIGAGSSMCSAVGWNLAAASLVSWLEDQRNPSCFLNFDGVSRYVCRVYKDLIID